MVGHMILNKGWGPTPSTPALVKDHVIDIAPIPDFIHCKADSHSICNRKKLENIENS